jgi:hypothetical protein
MCFLLSVCANLADHRRHISRSKDRNAITDGRRKGSKSDTTALGEEESLVKRNSEDPAFPDSELLWISSSVELRHVEDHIDRMSLEQIDVVTGEWLEIKGNIGADCTEHGERVLDHSFQAQYQPLKPQFFDEVIEVVLAFEISQTATDRLDFVVHKSSCG